ncbi:MAG: alanyl-tRNA editing protein [Anaerolineales bacterium]|nr:alanyl-tRNA editing protein [Anaerolineales bacterium]
MTERLYYDDSYTTQFDAKVEAVELLAGRPALRLDRTYFYPTSGGQPYDTGLLAGQRVIDVVAEDGAVWHIVDAPPQVQPGASVHGAIDWSRRYDHMQQHSGQHLLSQLWAQQRGFETVAVHFGPVESTLDLDAPLVTQQQIDELEFLANELAYTALPIRAYFVTDAEIGSLPLRRPPKVSGKIRIVEIAAFDYSACGGTHVRTTAEIAPIKILRQERRRGQTRLTFKCGLRACTDYTERSRLLVETAALFSTEIGAVPVQVQRVQEQNRDLQRQLDLLNGQLAEYEVAQLLGEAERTGSDLRIVRRLFQDRSVDTMKQLAAGLRDQDRTVALLATTVGDKLTLIFVRSADVDVHVGNVLRDTLAAFGGGGGGRPDYAQGGGVAPAQAQAILEYAEARLNL